MSRKFNLASQLIGRSVKPDNGSQRREGRTGRDSWRFMVNVSPYDKNNVMLHMRQELIYYNALVEFFSGKIRTEPKDITQVLASHEKVFLECARLGFNMRSIMFKQGANTELPGKLEAQRSQIFESGTKSFKITEKLMIFFEIASTPANIHPIVRWRIAKAVLRTFKEQAANMKVVIGSETQSYRNTPSLLETLDPAQKRHVQIPRELLKIKWDEDKSISKIYNPYTSMPLIINGINIGKTEEKREDGSIHVYEALGPWNILLLHQQGGTVAVYTTPWEIDLKTTNKGYLTDYLDQQSPWQGAFFAARRGR